MTFHACGNIYNSSHWLVLYRERFALYPRLQASQTLCESCFWLDPISISFHVDLVAQRSVNAILPCSSTECF